MSIKVQNPPNGEPSSNSVSLINENISYSFVPTEVWEKILDGFQSYQLIKLCYISRRFMVICQGSSIWRDLLFTDFALYDRNYNIPLNTNSLDKKRIACIAANCREDHSKFSKEKHKDYKERRITADQYGNQDLCFRRKYGEISDVMPFFKNEAELFIYQELPEEVPSNTKPDRFYQAYKQEYRSLRKSKESKEIKKYGLPLSFIEIQFEYGPLGECPLKVPRIPCIHVFCKTDKSFLRQYYGLLKIWEKTLSIAEIKPIPPRLPLPPHPMPPLPPNPPKHPLRKCLEFIGNVFCAVCIIWGGGYILYLFFQQAYRLLKFLLRLTSKMRLS